MENRTQGKFSICMATEFQPHGGGFYFLKAFEQYLLQTGYRVVKDIQQQYDILFTNHWMTPRAQIFAAIRKNPRVRIIQRIDGSARDYGRHDDADTRQAMVNRLADLTIFQSKYARHATREKFQVIRQDGPVIYNPVDLSLFSPDGERRILAGNFSVACVSWSTNPLKGSAEVYKTAHLNPDVDFYLCGNYPDAPKLSNLHLLGVLNREVLAEILRSCDALLTYSKNEACPNHVLEALASGLPIFYQDSGAMREIIGECGFVVDPTTFASVSNATKKNLKEISMNARLRAEKLFNPVNVFNTYAQKIRQSLEEPTYIPIRPRLVLAWFQWRPMRSSA